MAVAGMGGALGQLNATAKSADITLSEGNRRATRTGSASPGAPVARSITQRAGGKYYLEALNIVTVGAVGFVTPAKSMDEGLSATGGISVNTNGALNVNGADIVGVYMPSDGTTACFAIDLTARRVWYRRNAEAWHSGDPAAGTGGTDISAVAGALFAAVQPSSGSGAWRVALLQSQFANAVPSGFVAWG